MVKNRLLLILITGCTLQSRKDQASFRNFFIQKDFKQASKLLEGSSLKEDKKNQLVYLMEKGTLAYYQQDYAMAAKVFDKANALVDKLYTKSIREMVASSILNDNSKTFYGSLYERSMLYYYQALSFYMLAHTGVEKTRKLVDGKEVTIERKLSKDEIRLNKNRVRNSLIAWDSFFQEIKRIKGLKTFLKNDLVAKSFAAKMHEALNTRRDREIALQLYKDAYEVFKTYGPTKKIFNKKYKDYNSELRRFFDGEIKKKQIVSLDLTAQYKKTDIYLKSKILDLTKSVRGNQYKRALRKYPLKNYQPSRKNVVIHVEAKTISPTVGKDYSLNLRSAVENIENPTNRALVNNIGVPVLTAFALGPLGLGYVSHHGNVTVYSRHRAGEAMLKEVGIEFELPYAEANTDKSNYKLVIKKEDKVVEEIELSPLGSMSDIAFVSAQERIENSFVSRSTRVGIKYMLAIVAAYGTYKRVQESQGGELFAKPAAMAQFLLSQKGIKESEKADTRHWSSLPNLILSAELSLEPGKYQIFRVKEGGVESALGELEVESKREKAFFTHRFF